jgi:peptidoglycan hydrolase CwlO-like protein
MLNNQYYITETDVAKMLNLSGLPMQFQSLFARDYVSVKRQITDSDDVITSIGNRVGVLEGDVDDIETSITLINSSINSLDIRVTDAESDILDVASDLSAHVTDDSAHGATGDIVGTDDYCTLATGGTVKLAASVANAAASAVNAVLNPNAAGVAYLQADAATWVTMLNEHKANINQLTADLNAAITQLNLLMSNSRTALQLEP